MDENDILTKYEKRCYIHSLYGIRYVRLSSRMTTETAAE